MRNYIDEKSIFCRFEQIQSTIPIELEQQKTTKQSKVGKKKTLLSHSRMLHDPKTVIRSSFAQETAEKIAPQSIARLELANCKYSQIIQSSHRSHCKPLYSFPTFIFIGGRTYSERDRRSLASLHLVDSERVLSETRTTVFNRPPTREEFPSPDLCQIQIQRRFSFFRSLQIQIQRGFFKQGKRRQPFWMRIS